jgi:hypothetical protein
MITKQREPYEFLIRWEKGEIKGAHLVEIERVLEDGAILTERTLPAISVDPFGLSGLIDTSIVDQCAMIDELKRSHLKEVSILNDQYAAITEELATAKNVIAFLQKESSDDSI